MKKVWKITYISLGAAFLTAFVPLTIWAALGSSNYNEIEEIPAKLVLDEKVQTEYLEKEELNLDGINFYYDEDDKTAKMEDLKIEYNFDMSGTRIVTFVKEEGNKHYVAEMPVYVYHVRHLDARNYNIDKGAEEGTWEVTNFEVWAELNEPAKTLPRPEGFTEEQTVVILNPHQYKVSVSETSVEGLYDAQISAGNAKINISLYDALEFEADRVLHLINYSGTTDSLTLFVESSTMDYIYPRNSEGTDTQYNNIDVTGHYLFTQADGIRHLYPFHYKMARGTWDSEFVSKEASGGQIEDAMGAILDPHGYSVLVNGVNFYAKENEWHKAILGDEENATIINNGSAKMKYLANEKVNLDDLSFKYGDTTITAKECEKVKYDFSQPGKQNVFLTKTVDNKKYFASYTVDVIDVIAHSIEFKNVDIFKKSDGSYDTSSLVLWTYLTEDCDSLEKASDGVHYILDEAHRTIEFEKVNDRYTLFFVKAGAQNLRCALYTLINENSESKDTLTLVVEQSSSDYKFDYETEVIVTGHYIYEPEEGERTIFNFKYRKDANSWDSHFDSGSLNAHLYDYFDSETGGFKAVVNESVTFRSEGMDWHQPILGID